MEIIIDRDKTKKVQKKAKKSTWKNPINVQARSEMEQNIIDNLWKTKKTAAFFHVMTGLPVDELESVARMCLMKSAKSYDPSKPANFSTWVNRCLHLHLLNYLRDKSRILKMPRKYTEIYLKSRKLKKQNPDITVKEIAKALDVEEYQVVEVNECFNTKILDIYYFEEEVLGGGTGSIEDDLLDYRFSLEDDHLDGDRQYYQMSGLKTLSEKDILLLENVLVRGLCDNTLKKRYKKPMEELYSRVEELIDEIYFRI